MLFKRTGFPEIDEIIICTVNKVFPHSVFVTLDEFGKTGVIHISEVSPGRIRNIRDYVVEGKKVICKVLRIDQSKGHIDLSLRRVNDSQRREKSSQIKQEQLAEKILEFVAKKLKKELKPLYDEITKKVFEKYDSLYACFEDLIESETPLTESGIDKKLADELTPIIKQRIKPQEVEIKGKLHLKSYEPNGIESIKETMDIISKDKNISITYDSAGNYTITVNAHDYQTAEESLKKAIESATSFIEKEGGEASFERDK